MGEPEAGRYATTVRVAARPRPTPNCRRSAVIGVGAVLLSIMLLAVGFVVFLSNALQEDLTDSGPAGSVPFSTPFVSTPPTSGGSLAVGLARPLLAPLSEPWGLSDYVGGSTIFEPLASVGPAGAMPQLASSIEPSGDLRRWTITLPQGVRFHDGTPLDAAAVAANLEVARAHPRFASVLAPIRSMTAVGLTVVVELSAPWVTFPAVLTSQIGYIAQPATLPHPPLFVPVTTNALAGQPIPVLVGTGPFKAGRREARRFDVDRNPDYRVAGAPLLDRIEFVHVASGDQAPALRRGELDLIVTSEPHVIQQAIERNAETHTQVVLDPAARIELLVLNTTRGPLADPRLREAVDLAIDRSRLTSAGEQDIGRWVTGTSVPLVASGPGAPPGSSPPPDVRRAEQVVRERSSSIPPASGPASAPSPNVPRSAVPAPQNRVGSTATTRPVTATMPPLVELEFTLGIEDDGGDGLLEADAQIIRDQLGRVGIQVQIRSVMAREVATELAGGRTDAVLLLASVPADPDGWLPWLHTPAPGVAPINAGLGGSTDLDRELDARRGTIDARARAEGSARIDALARADRSYLWLQARPAALLASSTVTGLASLAADGFFTGGSRPWAAVVGVAR